MSKGGGGQANRNAIWLVLAAASRIDLPLVATVRPEYLATRVILAPYWATQRSLSYVDSFISTSRTSASRDET